MGDILIGRYARDLGLLTLPQAIHKMRVWQRRRSAWWIEACYARVLLRMSWSPMQTRSSTTRPLTISITIPA